jgi:hypothetical protein
MKFEEKLTLIKDKLDLKKSGYPINKKIFRAALFLLLALLIVAGVTDGFETLITGTSGF